jgi:trehalose 6-phosphate synthase/phosphatase
MDQLALIHFAVTKHTTYGQKVILVGDNETLGSWNALHGLHLVAEGSYPEWRTEAPVRLPVGSQVSYKYVVVEGRTAHWEELKENRCLLATDSNMSVCDVFDRLYSQIIIKPPVDSAMSPKLNADLRDVLELPPFKLREGDKWVFASMNLPLSVKRIKGSWEFKLYPGMWLPVLYQAALSAQLNFMWIGHPNIEIDDPCEQEDLVMELRKHRCIPIFLDKSMLRKQRTFCSKILFPLFHNIIDTDPDNMPVYDDDLWQAYRHVNAEFANKIKENYDGASVWIHDYQLLLTPGLISHSKPEVNIGLFLHSAFPSSEVYKVFKNREELLYSMVCCDIIGFHLFEYARNFITCCKRILGLDHQCIKGGLLGLKLYGRSLMIRVSHLGIEPSQIECFAKADKTQKLIGVLQERYRGLRILLSIDPLHRLSGIVHKFRSFRTFLASSRGHRQKNSRLVQIVYSLRNHSEADACSHRIELEVLRDEVNTSLGREAVELIILRKIDGEKRMAYMTVADALVNTSLRDGLCLQPFEFIALRSQSTAKVILSEFSGVSRALSSPYRVNPYDFEQLEDAYDIVIKQDLPRSRLKQDRDYEYIKTYTATSWAKAFMNDIRVCQKNTSAFTYVVHGLVDRIKIIALKRNFREIDETLLMRRYVETKNRVFFFDVEGTLCEPYKYHELSTSPGPASKVLRYLNTLAVDPHNTVFVVTGRKQEVLERWFNSAPEVGLAAEYGSFLRWKASKDWEHTYSGSNNWRAPASKIIESYVERTEGAQFVEKESSVSFMYRDADPDYGSLQAKELTSHLEIVLMHFMDECEISSGLGYIEVKQRGVNKGTTVYKILERICALKGSVDFVVAVGDDAADEEMFRMLQLLKKQSFPITVPIERLVSISCTIGRKPSDANYFAQDWQRLTLLLKLVCSWSSSGKLFFSQNDLTKLHRAWSIKTSDKSSISYNDDLHSPTEIFSRSSKRSQRDLMQ